MDRRRTLFRILRILLGGAAVLVLAFPAHAQAWGPLAHLSFSAQALGNVSVLGLDVQGLLQGHGNDFLYGSLAADIVVGKNLARFIHHCHNWKVGFGLFDEARAGAEKAFALGFLAHLAADTVAHNYFVPYKTVTSFGRLGTGHGYWELRYDQKIDPEMWRLARRVSTRAIREHDDLLHRVLTSASLLPFPVSRQLFGSLLASARIRRFQHVSRMALARERRLVLEPDLVAETNILSTGAVLGLLADGQDCRAARADATGERNLRMAKLIRKQLGQRVRRRQLTRSEATEIAQMTRESFRRAIHGKLVLPPSVAALAA
ncbi:MAG TPA: zinc dependent phospholipase C family protein [Anaeromyxobacteraceae bacterium]|nr:zinc dependent phospholipase C family protein [Anaeromyxobacteraceae bacterium]